VGQRYRAAGRLRFRVRQRSVIQRGAKVQVGRQAQGQVQAEWSDWQAQSQDRQGPKPVGGEKRGWEKQKLRHKTLVDLNKQDELAKDKQRKQVYIHRG
jgi:hypothetical protein